jgi:hypothetical protein
MLPIFAHAREKERQQRATAQHTSAYVSIRQHTSAYASIRQHTPAYASIRQPAQQEGAVGGNSEELLQRTEQLQLAQLQVHLSGKNTTKKIKIKHHFELAHRFTYK